MSATDTEARPLDDVLADLRFAMVGTADGTTWKSRPLTLAGRSGATLHFLVSADADWVQALDGTGSPTAGSPTTVTFSDPHKNSYVALQGSARAMRNEALIRDLWNPAAKAYFDSPDDPMIRVLEVEVEYGEYWDSPGGTVGRLLTMARAAAGKDPGREGPVSV
jgi:general stress protein 26